MDGQLLPVSSSASGTASFTCVGNDAHQQMLAAGDHLGDRPVRQIQRGEPWHAEVRGCQHLPGEGLVELGGSPPDGVPFRHRTAPSPVLPVYCGCTPYARIRRPFGVEYAPAAANASATGVPSRSLPFTFSMNKRSTARRCTTPTKAS